MQSCKYILNIYQKLNRLLVICKKKLFKMLISRIYSKIIEKKRKLKRNIIFFHAFYYNYFACIIMNHLNTYEYIKMSNI